MRSLRFDWRWIALIVVIALIASSGRLPWFVNVLVLAGAGGYLVYEGWRVWVRSGGVPSRSRVTYWRGQRYETGPERRGLALPRLSDIGPAAMYLLFGGVLLLAGIVVVLRQFGL